MASKKSLYILATLLLIALSSCGSTKTLTNKEYTQTAVRLAPHVTQEMLSASYWTARIKKPHAVKMTKAEISAWNKEMFHTTLAGNDDFYLLYDLRTYDSVVSSYEIRKNMIRYSKKHPWYTKKAGETHTLTEKDWRAFYTAMHFSPLGDFAYFSGAQNPGVDAKDYPVRKAITVRRSNLRLVPDDTAYTDDTAYWYDDVAQNSGVLMNEPVLVLWESQDKKWLYVQTSFCPGWIHREDVAFCTDEQFARYFDYTEKDEKTFITITADRYVLSDEYAILHDDKAFKGIPELFMGTYLHTASWEDERFADSFFQRKPYACYIAEIPYKQADETLGITYAAIPAGICTEGLLEYTTAHVLEQAFKPLGIRYGWGGMAESRDCSEYLKDIFRCFGFLFARNSRSQLAMPGATVSFDKKSVATRKSAISSLQAGTIMGFPGHVCMYLGESNGKQYAISALGAYYFDDPSVFVPIDANSVSVNTLDVIRKNGKTWLENITQAKAFANDGTITDHSVALNKKWKYASFSKINTGTATLFKAKTNRRNIVVAVNAGHGTKGGAQVKTYSHPDKSPKLTTGTTAANAIESIAVSDGMTFADGKTEADVNLRTARLFKAALLKNGFDVLMIRDSTDVQLDNIARTVISNNMAAIHIAIHYDLDAKTEDKGCFYCSIPEGLRKMKPVKTHWKESERLGTCLIEGLRAQELPIYGNGTFEQDLTQIAFSTIPTVDIELGNQHTDTSTEALQTRANGLLAGVLAFFSKR